MAGLSVDVELPEKCDVLFSGARYLVLFGGRGGGKSHSIARALLVRGMQRRHRILCTREFQISIRDSVHRLLTDQIDLLGLGAFYRVTQTQITGINGTEFIFAGLRHSIDSIKSTEGISIAWCEEASRISEASWQILIPTIRVPGSQIYVSFNPENESDPVYQRFVVNPPPDAKVVKIGWQDNKWISNELIREKDYLYSVDAEAAAHVWGGELIKLSVAQVLRGRYAVEAFEPETGWNGPYFGADWGFSVDPTALVKLWINARTLYIEHEAYGVGVDIDDTPALFDTVPGAREHTIRADSSRPETISHMRRHGYPKILGCTKGKGSVEDGVEHLRSYERIIIHPRCTHAAEEARLWSYKVDKLTGDVLPVLLDRHDHIFDAARYALEQIIRAGKPRAKPKAAAQKRHDYNREDKRADGWKVV